MDLTTHFKLEEVVCKCGCQGHRQHLDAINRGVTVLQIIRNHWMAPVLVNSGYRCAFHNVKVGGVAGSYHIQGKAFDIRPQFGDFKQFCDMLRGLENGALHGVIWVKVYPSFVHVDVRYL